MSHWTKLWSVVLVILLSTPISTAVAKPPLLTTKSKKAQQAYRQGHEALSDSRWAEALQTFKQMEQALEQSKEAVDAALYWQAYTLTRLGRSREAELVADRLIEQYPKSPWRNDAKRLGRTTAALTKFEAADDEDVMMAVDALMASSSPRAVPLLRKLLAGQHSDKIKARALFVLSQLDAQAADEALQQIIRQKGSDKLKERAIRMIAAAGNRDSFKRLEAIYRQEPSLRRAVIKAWVVGARKDLLLRTAKQEKDAALVKRAINALGALGAGPELFELYGTRKGDDDRRIILRSMGVAGATEQLSRIAENDKLPAVRKAAIRALGVAGAVVPLKRIVEQGENVDDQVAAIRALAVGGGRKSAKFIASQYANPTLRDAVIEALTICGGTEEMIQIYRQETDRGRKRRLLRRLVATDSDIALDLIESQTENGGR